MIKVSVPATSANLGPGFDCMGAALNIYNTVEVEESDEGLKIEISGLTGRIPCDESNLVYKAMKTVFDKVGYNPRGLRIKQTNNIPITKGLGSSAASIVGGLFAANRMVDSNLSRDELTVMAAQLDGHPDNTTAAITGGLAVSVLEGGNIFYSRIEIPDRIRFAAFIPDFTLPTTKARMMLPERVQHKDAVFNAGRAALLAASLSSGKLENLSCAVEDRIHQPYRKKLIPSIDRIFDISLRCGARGCYLSGAGPVLMALLDRDYDQFYSRASSYLKSLIPRWELKILELDKKGVDVFVN